MFKEKCIFILICVSSFIASSLGAVVPPTWTGTNMIQAGSVTIVLSKIHQQAGNQYVYTYAPAYSATPFTALGIISFQTENLLEENLKYLVNNPDYTSTTRLVVKMVYPTDTAWRTFKVSYIAIDTAFNMVKVDYFAVTNPANVNSGLGQRTYTGTFNLNIGTVDITHAISIIPFLVGITSNSVNGEHDIKWSTKLKDASSITYDLTVKRTTRVTSLTSYIMVVDRSEIAFDMEKYLDELYVTGVQNKPNNQDLIYRNAANMHVGLKQFTFELNAFDIVKASLGLTTTGYYNYIGISVLAFRQRHCNDPTMPYYEQITNLCYDNCPTGSVNADGTSKKYCPSCNNYIFGCKQCAADGLTCSLAYGNYIVDEPTNTTCSCPDGFYQSSDLDHMHPLQKCRDCHFSCQTCGGVYSFSCITCKKWRTQDQGSCNCDYGTKANGDCFSPCNDQACDQCDADVAICEVCTDSFTLSGSRCICGPRMYFDSVAVACFQCHYSCYYCSGPNANQCNTCDRQTDKRYFDQDSCLCISNYEEVNVTCQIQYRTSCPQQGYQLDTTINQCVQTCGDGVKIELECDDGNVDNEDGCSSQCKIQAGYVCADNSLAPTQRSYCSYESQLQFELLDTTKWIYENKVNLTFRITPGLHHIFSIYKQLTTNITFGPEEYKLTTTSAKYDPETKLLYVHLKYGQSIHDKELQLTFKPPKTAQTFAVPVSRSKLSTSPSNHIRADYYEDSIYVGVQIGRVLAMSVSIIALILACALLFYRKMMGLELITMLQLVFFAALLADYSHPFMAPTHEISYVNGYNGMNVGYTGEKIDNDFKTLGYYPLFFVNYNFMMVLSLGIYLFALILFIVSLLTDRSSQRKLKDASQFFINEIGMGLMIFSLNNFVISLILEVLTGNVSDFTYIWSKVFFSIVGIIFIAHIGYFVYTVHEVSDSQLYYHRHKNYTHYYPLALIIRNCLIALFIAIRPLTGTISCIICVALQVLYIASILAGRPYRKFFDYARFIAVQTTLLFYLASRLVWEYSNDQDEAMDYFFMVTSYVVLAGLFISIVFTIVSFIYHLYLTCKKNSEVNPQAVDKQELDNADAINKKEAELFSQFKNSKGRLKETQKSKQLMVYDFEQYDDKQRRSPKKNLINYPDANGSGYGLFGEENGSLATSVADPESRRKLRRDKKRRIQYS